jgi:tetratricopeptide (TPR) repeat protein/transcriptional regulator with XRE-family HTH domain
VTSTGTGDGFGPLLRRRRQAAGLTQEELAEAAGVSVRSVSDLERGTRRPYQRTIRRLADALDLATADRDELTRASQRPADDAAPGPGQPAARREPRQLPATTTEFTGRSAELKMLSGLLEPGERPPGTLLITAIDGTAGVGKTALAVHWAHQAAGRFPDGQLYINLRGYDPGQPVPAADALAGFLRALGVPGRDIPTETDERAALYRSLLAVRRMLVVLDNASDAEQVRSLLPASPGCVAVVTSRDTLAGLVARDGAARVNLDLLPEAEAVGLLRALIGERAYADPASARILAAQCARLPLALRVAAELAVARPNVSLAELAAELADQQRRLELLDAGGDQRTAVRSVFSWSYQNLAPAAARLFRLAGLHPGPDLDGYAAAALTGTTLQQANAALRQLVRAHLIQPAGPGRYTGHDLLRAYARELATSQDGADGGRAALTRLFDHYLHTAAEAMNTLFPAERHRRPVISRPATPTPPLADTGAAQAWLDTQRPNLVALAVHASGHGWPGHATRLSATLFRYLETGGYYPEANTIHACAYRGAREAKDVAAQATALINLAIVYSGRGRYREASRRYELALALCRETGDRPGQARALINRGVTRQRQGRYTEATKDFQLALAIYRETGDPAGQARAVHSLGAVDLMQGRCQQAAGHFRQAMAIYRATSDGPGEVMALSSLTAIERLQGHYQQAADLIRQALRLSRDTGDRFIEAETLTNLALMEDRQGRRRQATEHYRQALTLYRAIGDRAEEGHLLASLGSIEARAGRHRQAAALIRQSLALFRDMGHRPGEAMALEASGVLDQEQGRYEQAAAHHEQALAIYVEAGQRRSEVRSRLGLGAAYLATGRPGPARSQYGTALSVARQTGDVYEQARTHDGLGHASRMLGEPEQARHHWTEALTLYTRLGAPEAAKVSACLAGLGPEPPGQAGSQARSEQTASEQAESEQTESEQAGSEQAE